jgi:hypothetical protein
MAKAYGISVKSYLLLHLAPCSCCGYSGKRSEIDHDHACCAKRPMPHDPLCGNCIRGPLCHTCNSRGCLDFNAYPPTTQIRPCAVAFANTGLR